MTVVIIIIIILLLLLLLLLIIIAKITQELSEPNEKSDAKQDGIQHTKARLGESLKKKWKTK